MMDPDHCAYRFGHVRVEGFDRAGVLSVWLRVTFEGTPTGWTETAPGAMRVQFLTQQPPPEVAIYPSFLNHLSRKNADERRKLPGVVLGMREDEVLAGAWGVPLSRKVLRSRRESLWEEWDYPDGNVLYFQDGVLDGFET